MHDVIVELNLIIMFVFFLLLSKGSYYLVATSNFMSFQIYEELVQGIKDAEEGLFLLKRARLLREVDATLDGSGHTDEDVKPQPLQPEPLEPEPLQPEPLEPEPLEDPNYSIGSKCRFLHTDGRWYNGQIVGLDNSNVAKISFLTPTSENMMVSMVSDPLSTYLLYFY